MTSELISKWQSVGFTHGEVSPVHCLSVVIPYSSVAAFWFTV